MNEEREAPSSVQTDELEQASGGIDIFSAFSMVKQYELFICPRPKCHGKIVFSKHRNGVRTVNQMQCASCGWKTEYAANESPKAVWELAKASFSK